MSEPGVVGVRRVGDRALLAEVGSAEEAAALAAFLRASGLVADDVVPAARSVLVDGVDGSDGVDMAAAERLVASWPGGRSVAAARTVVIPVTYDGPDLELVASRWGVSVSEVVARHTSLTFTSAFCGFAPGFAYLAGLPREWQVPRLADPRPRVPAGSLAIAGEWCGVYPTASPGGWLLLGCTAVSLWDPAAAEPALLAPGTRVRFAGL
ncbi:sensor histidine kinase inhibitor, KipI family [Nocardioides terrae]|uniref:Sensor histidine kinase inhibitor, KipI family n=1 Tax=Nocardioides terrae TaxID=574651 RepID=A0A1I1FWW6_9ACTN|nr:carboxyltransferase domain-containing protein [Nocardioides terrae]SFC02108.1 sensor histidine kinase inhibitor, KipI family [Nocardioides terrae]